jgi:hypothetical protein
MNREEFCKLLDTLSNEELEAFYQYLKALSEKCQKGGEIK